MTPHLNIDNATIGYNGMDVVHKASLELISGEIGCLLGPSGCGKSTLLRAIAGFEDIATGSIALDGKTLSSVGYTLSTEQREVGMVFQDIALFPHLTVAENIVFGIKKWSKREQVSRVERLLSLINLENMGERYPHQLSGGQQQRVALARAIAPKPKLLLLDEPFSGLDASLREVLVLDVKEVLKQEKVSAVLVTHDQMEAFAMADRVAVMQAGCIQQWDLPYTIYHEPRTRFVAQFIGQGEFLHGTVNDNGQIESALGILKSTKKHRLTSGQDVEVLLRPDDVLHNDDSSFKGKIISKRFRGSHFLYRIEMPSKQRLFCFASSHHNHAIGEDIGIDLDLDHLVMFPLEPQAVL